VQSLHRIDPADIDVLIIDEVHGAGSEDAFNKLRLFSSCRIYGFSATPFGRHDKADMAPSALCGPIRVDLDYKCSVEAGANVPLHVYTYVAKGRSDLASMPDWLKDRLGIVRNTDRNKLAAHVCRQIPESDQVLVVCRTLEHVLRLKQVFPSDYVCVSRKPDLEREAELVNMGLLPSPCDFRSDIRFDEEAQTEFEAGTLKKVIATPIWREGVDFPHLRWLVRMDGTVNEIACIQIGGRLARRTKDKGVAVLIDFYDKFSDFSFRSTARFARYAKEGWCVQHIG